MKHWGLNDNVLEHDSIGKIIHRKYIEWYVVIMLVFFSLKWYIDRFRFWAIYCHKCCTFMKMVPADNFEAYNEYWLILLRHSIVTSIQEGMSATLWFRERHIITFLPCNSWYFGTLQGVKMQSIYRYLYI